MPSAAIDIPNLLYRYADFMDAGDFGGAANMFEGAKVYFDDQTPVSGAGALVAAWQSWVKLYDGRPRTRHIITNPIIDLSEDEFKAKCQSQWTVLQAAEGLPLQVIATGRYKDTFELANQKWKFKTRRYAGMDLIGNMSQHVMKPVKEKAL